MSAIRQLAAWCCALVFVCGSPLALAGPSLAECHGIKDLVVVAHQDDDLLFMNPDVDATIDAGGCVRVVYLTAAERGEGVKYMLGRERGVRAAYAYLAQEANAWSEDVVAYGDKHQARFTLNGNPRISLVHVRLSDPWLGSGWGSLTPLSRTESVPGATAHALGPYGESYNRADLVKAIAAVIRDYEPTVIRHMDDTITIPYTSLCWRCEGHDHPDHIASARLVRDAMKMEPRNYAESGYVDYPTQERATNLTAAEIAEKTNAFKRYAWDDYRYCAGPDKCDEPAGTAAAWVSRTYYVPRRTVPPALVADKTNGFLLFTVGELNSAANMLHSVDKQWSSLGGRIVGRIIGFNFADGRAGLLARDAMGRLWANTQTSENRWRGWEDFDDVRIVSLPIVASNADGRHGAVVMANDGRFYYTMQPAIDGNWSPRWSPLPPLNRALPDAAMALTYRGRLAVFAADRDGRLWTSAQAEPGSRTWSPWYGVGNVATSGGLAAMRNRAGLIELYARDKRTGHMLQLIQSTVGPASGQWAAPKDLGFAYIGQPTIGLNEKGDIAIAALEHSGGACWLAEGLRVTNLGGGVESSPVLRTIKDTLYVIGRSNDIKQTYRVWSRFKNDWQASHLLSAPQETGGASFIDGDEPDNTPVPVTPAVSPILLSHQ